MFLRKSLRDGRQGVYISLFHTSNLVQLDHSRGFISFTRCVVQHLDLLEILQEYLNLARIISKNKDLLHATLLRVSYLKTPLGDYLILRGSYLVGLVEFLLPFD